MIKKMLLIFTFMLFCFILAANDNFPYRKDFPGVPTISTEELKTQYDSKKIVIVDVRSKIEYDVIHPVGALHIPISNKNFVEEVKTVISKNKGKNFAFYCNGITCLKSYEATQKMIEAGCKNCFAYDAGVPEWSEKHPKKTLLLNKTINDPKKQLIPKSEFKKLCLSFDDFKAKAAESNAFVIDARDYIQNSGKLPGLENVRTIPLDILIPNFIEKKKEKNKTLLIFDQVGKQVRWLMYYLVANGYKNYYFLNKGATGVLGEQKYKD